MIKVGIIGLGRMGGAMARNLLRKGYELYVYDLVKSKIEDFAKLGSKGTSSPAEMASIVDVLLTNVPKSEDMLNVYLGENGILKAPRPGLIAIETTTTDIPSKLKLAEECSKKSVGFLVAMLGLTVPQAERGETPLFVGGPKEIFENPNVQRLLMDLSSGKIYYMGNIETAVAFKLITNTMGFAQLLVFLEGLQFVTKFGMSIEDFLKAAKDTAAYNYWFDARREKILKEDYSAYFPVDFIIKDLMYTLESAKNINCPLPMASLAIQFYIMASSKGYGSEDGIALMKILREYCKGR
ncbi:6-phosphogluconate dehydrogenase NAD-binding protein [Vulcanisaeta moutnovskia 768-28]|uniref:6-phosphogluconate dehydrogenase NAD-binding protein n=1 Tax=Vulcanisaeta moutnovskia (strain 768-28) TaxID=985053 RepID=F0QYL5_VULM7|nr:NAD(P)-dependent oxidoreductase [Vulcanisaeta moutnovskia]ADY01448.1 6-phosphogluconate dehydrogenase NAD-binding protein [Vulcanisaeta moutnovskia 768-28]